MLREEDGLDWKPSPIDAVAAIERLVGPPGNVGVPSVRPFARWNASNA
jgi:hypothetical protein